MIHLQIITDLEGVTHDWGDITRENFGTLVGVGRLRAGTERGKSTVTVRVELPDGSHAYGETTLEMLRAALAAFDAAELRDAERLDPGLTDGPVGVA